MSTLVTSSRLLALLALSVPLLAQAYSASVTTRAAASVSVIGAPGSTDHLPPERTAATNTAGGLALGNSANALTTQAAYTASASGHASAIVSPGVVSVVASGGGYGTASPPTWYQSDSTGYAYAAGGFSDTMTLNIANVAPGTPVSIDFSVRFDGVASVNRTAVAGGWGQGGGDYQWNLQITSPGWGAGMLHNSGTRTLQVDAFGNVTHDSLDFGTHTFSTTLLTGAPLGLNAWAWVQAFGRGGFSFCPSGCTDQMAGGGSSVMDASHTLAWNGVQAVRLMDGSAVALSSVSFMTETGLDLLLPVASVPEPGAAALALAGLLVVGLKARRR
jgi:hypothetical protein